MTEGGSSISSFSLSGFTASNPTLVYGPADRPWDRTNEPQGPISETRDTATVVDTSFLGDWYRQWNAWTPTPEQALLTSHVNEIIANVQSSTGVLETARDKGTLIDKYMALPRGQQILYGIGIGSVIILLFVLRKTSSS